MQLLCSPGGPESVPVSSGEAMQLRSPRGCGWEPPRTPTVSVSPQLGATSGCDKTQTKPDDKKASI